MGDLFIRMDSMISLNRTQQDRFNQQCGKSTKFYKWGSEKNKNIQNLELFTTSTVTHSPKNLLYLDVRPTVTPWINTFSESHSQKPFQNIRFCKFHTITGKKIRLDWQKCHHKLTIQQRRFWNHYEHNNNLMLHRKQTVDLKLPKQLANHLCA